MKAAKCITVSTPARAQRGEHLIVVAYVSDDERRVADRLRESARQIVQHDHGFAARAQLQDDMAADVTGAARDQNAFLDPCRPRNVLDECAMINKREDAACDAATVRRRSRRATAIRPFADLSPDVVLDAAASVGIEGDGRLLALNSYENRVYQLGTDAGNRGS